MGEMLTQHLTQHYTTEGGKDDPQGYTNFMLRLMQRPFLLYDPEMFSENVQTEVSTLASLQFTNLPEAGALLYKYNDDGSRDTTSASFVGSVQVFSEAPGVIYTRARLLGAVVTNSPGDKTRKVTFWTNCEADGALLDVDVNYPGSVAHSVENDFSTQVTAVTPSIRDICSLTEETTSSSDLKNIIKNIKG